ncbi:hypothetical protein [Rhodovulum steppense]|uniref:hypothetical protein n=1 Tax=Rhodovulum steppense TaxID=540251 RepID=UPI001049388C|nr:hypothetical protein [Rhodovulum steppense]
MKKLTLDWNCVLAVENGEVQGRHLEELVTLHRAGQVQTALLQTSASENMRGTRGFPGSYDLFEGRLEKLGWEDLPRLPTPGVWGLTFWDRFYWVDQEVYERLTEELWHIMFPNLQFFVEEWSAKNGEPSGDDFAGPEFARFRNAWCDVHSAYCHIEENRDLFISMNTRDFQTNGQSLRALGLMAVTPEEALAVI